MHTNLDARLGAVAALALVASCGVDEPSVGEATSALTVADFTTSSCTTAVVIGLSTQIADEISCLSPSSLVRFSATSGISITSNAVLPFLAANARTDLQKVGSVQVNSAFRTVAQQFLLLEWFNRGRCGITAAAAVGRSNHESGRAVDLANASSRVTAMANHGWSHDVPGDPVHFDHLSSADIRGKDTLAFQRLWNRNHPGDRISEDGVYGPQTESRLKKSPATGFAAGAFCKTAAQRVAIAAVDGPDRVAPGTRAHYRITLSNATDTEWPATATIAMADGQASQLYDATSWVNNVEIGPIGAPIPAGGLGVYELDIVAPSVATATPIQTELAVVDGDTQVGSVDFAVTITPDGDENMSGDSDDQNDDGAVSGGCTAGHGVGWLAFAPVLLVLRRRRR
ncbi:MAG TPA: M15 family metallopeptidase [Kofleriaceae bacterium]|nr:M15 family metallopeptidase [Kofleriaceae bacterium]